MTTWVGKIYSIVPCSGNEMKEIPVDNLCLLTGWLAGWLVHLQRFEYTPVTHGSDLLLKNVEISG